MTETIFATFFASTGFWAFLTVLITKKMEKNKGENKMLVGLAHDRICYLGSKYVNQGYITKEDYENLHDYLYIPYKELGGNGTAEKIMNEVEKLPLHNN